MSETKLKKVLGVDILESATDKDLEKLGTKTGYVHSWGIKGANFIGDIGLPLVKNYIGGQKENKTDSINVNYGRDFKYEMLADIVEARENDTCAQCKKGKLQKKIGFEWGHCFKQDHFYTKPQEGYFINKNGEKKLLWMGAYGIGIERSIACIVEAHHDERGIVWPKSVAPYQAHLIAIGEVKEVIRKSEEVYKQLCRADVELLYDDREGVSAGAKFADADLIGIPVRLVISEKTKDKVEWKGRSDPKIELLSLERVTKRLSNNG